MDDGSIRLYISCTNKQAEHNIKELKPVTANMTQEPLKGYKVILKKGNTIYMAVGMVDDIIEEVVGQI
ncbi:MAG: hypothetical protein N2V78_09555 [Methanophagales archaeon]|nr:hypothetical protein [Methanophagales archaeon]